MTDTLAPSAKATFTELMGKSKGTPRTATVHFNPATLQLTQTNSLEAGKQDKTVQHVTQSSTKLTMDLIFDTTPTGKDVRDDTRKVAGFMGRPPKTTRDKQFKPASVRFEWGLFSFDGVFESYKETLEFFSGDGVPLRASVNLTMSRLDVVFDEDGDKGKSDAVVTDPGRPGRGASDTAAQGGDPSAGRDIAAANNEENMRFPS
ncbi:MAG: hypothetical protein ACJ8DC_07620, partial [Gemmatimonadales bacterium]